MDKKIREAFEKWDNDTFWGASSTEWAFEAGYLAAQAEHDAEVDNLVSTLSHIMEYWNRDRNNSAMHDALWHIIETCEDEITLYHQIDCQECGGTGDAVVVESNTVVVSTNCIPCKGSGKVWRKKDD